MGASSLHEHSKEQNTSIMNTLN